MKSYKLFFSVSIIFLVQFIVSCTSNPAVIGAKVDHDEIVDGIYEGSYRSGPVKAAVKVTINKQRITDIELTRHTTWKGKKAEIIVPSRIIEEQSTKVDAVSGATMSSQAIMNAVQIAIDKARK